MAKTFLPENLHFNKLLKVQKNNNPCHIKMSLEQIFTYE